MSASPRVDDNTAPLAITLEYATVTASMLEAATALISGIAAGSVALLAFGSDAIIEMLSALVVVAELRHLVGNRERNIEREHRAHRALAVLFFSLAAYVVAIAAAALIQKNIPSRSWVGLAVCVASSVLMPVLARWKRQTSVRLAHQGFAAVARLLAADAAETMLCALLSVSTLVGVVLSGWVGWWWADPVASVVVVYFALREGREAWACASN